MAVFRGYILTAVLMWSCSPSNAHTSDAGQDHQGHLVDALVDPSPAERGFVDALADALTEPSSLATPGPRSSLFPEDWVPGYRRADGAFLHDFSYAGFDYGAEPDVSSWPVTDVAQLGADSTGREDVSQRIIDAIAAAPAEGAVLYFPAGTYLIERRILVTRPNLVFRGDGGSTRFWFRFRPGNFESQLSFQSTASVASTEWRLAMNANALEDSVIVEGLGPTVGQEITLGLVITQAFVDEHGMDAYWAEGNPFFNRWQPLQRRTVVRTESISVDGAMRTRVILDVPLRMNLKTRDAASLRMAASDVHTVGVEHLSVSNALPDINEARASNGANVIGFSGVRNAFVRDVRSFAVDGAARAPAGPAHLQSSGIRIVGSRLISISNTHLAAPQNNGEGGNGYLFEISQSNEILIRDSSGTGGRHNFIQNWGFGTSGCVFLRVHSSGGQARHRTGVTIASTSEFHHSLATANLIDSSRLDDGWTVGNRRSESSGAGHAGSENVFWNPIGEGTIRSFNFRSGYIVGPDRSLTVITSQSALENLTLGVADIGTAPEDEVESSGSAVYPQSLYEAQRQLRRG